VPVPWLPDGDEGRGLPRGRHHLRQVTGLAGWGLRRPLELNVGDGKAGSGLAAHGLDAAGPQVVSDKLKLQQEGYEALVAHNGQEGLRKAQTQLPGLIILDLLLPVLGGPEVCREIRKGGQTRAIPILILSAKAEETDQVAGFVLGADDYVTKPFSVRVLLQRVKALLRRRQGTTRRVDVIEHQVVTVDRVRHRAFVQGKELDLPPTEFRLLECLLRQPGRAFSRKELMAAGMGEDALVEEGTVDVHIKALRRKLGTPDLIQTSRGVGYRFREDPGTLEKEPSWEDGTD
jgi:two-component system phosphate regulon response regulator PhoB